MEIKKSNKSDFIKTKDGRKTIWYKKPYGTKNSFKHFIEYNDNDVIRPLCIKPPQMTGYVRKFEGNTTKSFKISDKQMLKSTIKYGKESKYY